MEVVIYKAGRDFSYLRKYGMVSRSMLVINEEEKVEDLSEQSIRDAFERVVEK